MLSCAGPCPSAAEAMHCAKAAGHAETAATAQAVSSAEAVTATPADVRTRVNNRQIADYLTDDKMSEFWPVMWKYKTWKTKQWERADGNPIPSIAIREQRLNNI